MSCHDGSRQPFYFFPHLSASVLPSPPPPPCTTPAPHALTCSTCTLPAATQLCSSAQHPPGTLLAPSPLTSCTHTHAHAHTHTYIHTHTHARTHTLENSEIFVQFSCTHSHLKSETFAHIHTRIHTHLQTLTRKALCASATGRLKRLLPSA